MKAARPTALIVLAGVLLAGCTGGPEPPAAPRPRGEGDAVRIVATIPALAMIAAQLGGGRVEAGSLLRAGASPHTFEPLPGDVVTLRRADLVVRIGAGFDDWLADRLIDRDATEVFVVTDIADLALLDADHHHEAEHGDAEHHAGRVDPHVWLDPLRVGRTIAPALAARMIALDPDHASDYERRRDELTRSLDELDDDIRTILAAAPARSYVAFHNAWRYFARRYGLNEVAVVHEAAGEEPTPKELGRLVVAAREAGVAAILVEPQLDPRLARTIAADFGARTITVDPLGDSDSSDRATYQDLMLYNARAFARAMGASEGEAGR